LQTTSWRTLIGVLGVLIPIAIGAGVTAAYFAVRYAGETGALALTAEGSMIALACALVGVAAGFGIRRASMRRVDQVLEEQKTQQLRFDTAINNMSQGLCFFDGNQRLIVCNDLYASMYRLTRELVRPGTTLGEIIDHRFAAGSFSSMTREEYKLWRDSIAISSVASDTVVELKDGRTIAIHHQPMPDGGWVATHEDVTEKRRAVTQIERMARHDSLTDLPNRLLFRERLEESVRRGGAAEALAVLCVDLDRFKAVNDTLGHPAGDELLRAVARRLSDCVRQTDMVARLGGDEFAIIQAGGPQPVAATALAARLVRAIAAPFEIGGHKVSVGASVGIALSPEHGLSPDDLLKKADLALY
jgi:diguanylate cyclase (GGDEF)-like protein